MKKNKSRGVGPLDRFGRTFGGRVRKKKMLAIGETYPFGGSADIDSSYFEPDKRRRL